jgi:hypothetical protein
MYVAKELPLLGQTAYDMFCTFQFMEKITDTTKG